MTTGLCGSRKDPYTGERGDQENLHKETDWSFNSLSLKKDKQVFADWIDVEEGMGKSKRNKRTVDSFIWLIYRYIS